MLRPSAPSSKGLTILSPGEQKSVHCFGKKPKKKQPLISVSLYFDSLVLFDCKLP